MHRFACREFHGFLVQMGLRDVESKPKRVEADDAKWTEVKDKQPALDESTYLSLEGIPRVLEVPAHHRMGDCLPVIHNWLVRLTHAPNATPMWLCSYQLLAHFQGCTSAWGFEYKASEKRWVLADNYVDRQGFDFLKLSAWLVALVKEYASSMGLQAVAHAMLPWGSTFRLYQRCLLIRCSPADFAAVDREFRTRGAANLKKVKPFLCKLGPMKGFLG